VDRVEAVVIGAGLVGLAVARALALAGREVVILEAEEAIGTHTSSRNSEVIHAGIYYPQGSLKARACVEGRQRLYAYCAERGVPHRRSGKLIVATDAAQLDELEAIRRKAHANGVTDVVQVSPSVVREMEPELACVAALHSPSTGIIDSHALMLAYLGDAQNAGAMLALKSTLQKGVVRTDGIELHVAGAEPILATRVVNCAGLTAPSTARRIAGYPAHLAPPEFYAKGNYYTLARRAPFSRLIYPVPEPGGLGVHVTLDLGGRARFGPDVEWVQAIDYRVDPARAERFYAAIRRYWPGLPEGALEPGYAGIRPKISGRGTPAADFLAQGPREHGVRGLVQMFGIESPGLTASLALADHAAALLSEASIQGTR
jgi:L-2-hydroxyglutarate oxidase LhgO